jgi:hypothetical protein
MKFIRLSSVVLVSVLTLNSGVAMSRGIDQTSSSTSSVQTEPLQTEPLMISNIFFDLRNPVRTIRNGLSREQRRQARERRMQEIMQARERRRQELEVARREATEQQRLEAEQRQQYFESLSPEEKKTYLAEQRARRDQADKAAALFFLMLFSGGFGSNQEGLTSDDDGEMIWCYHQTTYNDGSSADVRNRQSRRSCRELSGKVVE